MLYKTAYSLLITIVLTAIIVSCGKDKGLEPDTTPPEIESVEPADMSFGVAATDSVLIRFSEAIAPVSVTSSSIIFTPAVTGSFTVDGALVLFHPDSDFEFEASITVEISTAVTDLAGNPLSIAFSWQFTIEPNPVTGKIWTAYSSGATLNDLAYHNGLLVGVGDNGLILTSNDGVNWATATIQGAAITTSFNALFSSDDLLVAVGDSGLIATSLTGAIWTRRLSGTSRHLNGVAWTGSIYYAVGDSGTVIESDSARIWNASLVSSVVTDSTQFVAVVSSVNPQRMIALGYKEVAGTRTGLIIQGISPVMFKVFDRGSILFNDVFWDADLGGSFTAVGVDLTDGGAAAVTVDGITWSPTRTGVAAAGLNALSWSGQMFVAVGEGGSVTISTDGNSWSEQTSGSSSDLNGIVWTGSQFVAVGDGGVVLISPDNSLPAAKLAAIR